MDHAVRTWDWTKAIGLMSDDYKFIDGFSKVDAENCAIGYAVFVIVALVQKGHLPSQPSAARRRVPSRGLAVEHGLRERQPLRLVRGRVWVILLCRAHRRKCPKSLIVVSEILVAVGGHVVPLGPDLEQQRLCRDIVEPRVARVPPVVDQRL